MNFNQINDFVVQNESAEHFEKDRELFVKTFPKSRIIPSLFSATQFEKKKLDGRMLIEMLSYVSPQEILNNRKPIAAPDGDPSTESEDTTVDLGTEPAAPDGDPGTAPEDQTGDSGVVTADDSDAAPIAVTEEASSIPAVNVGSIPSTMTTKKKGKGKNTRA